MRRETATVLMLLLAVTPGRALEWSGYGRNYLAALTEKGGGLAVMQNTLDLRLEDSRGAAAFSVNPWLRSAGDTLAWGLREAYVDFYFDAVDVRLGKQQIIWGKADGVFITDVVSPRDLREFLLPDFAEIRRGVMALKLDFYPEQQTWELVWVPEFVPTLPPAADGLWAIHPDYPVNPVFDHSREVVPATLENSEIFGKFSFMGSRLDLELMGGYMWDDDPVGHLQRIIDPDTHQLTGLVITPRHHRLGLAGGSFSSTLGPVVLRGEGAYYGGRYFNTSDPAEADGTLQRDFLHYLLGLDWTLWEVRLSTQLVQQVVLDYDPMMERDEVENTVTFLASRDFLRETLRLELFAYLGINAGDALWRPRAVYQPADGLELQLGANVFTGSEGRFGQYGRNDMVFSKVKYSF